MKKILLLTLAAMFAAAGLYAEGAREAQPNQPAQPDPLAAYRNSVNLTGTLQFENGFPVLNAGGKTYALFARRFTREAFTLKPGLALGIEGYVAQPGPRFQKARENDTERPAFSDAILVQKVTIDGKTYDIAPDRSGREPFAGGRKNRGPGRSGPGADKGRGKN